MTEKEKKKAWISVMRNEKSKAARVNVEGTKKRERQNTVVECG